MQRQSDKEIFLKESEELAYRMAAASCAESDGKLLEEETQALTDDEKALAEVAWEKNRHALYKELKISERTKRKSQVYHVLARVAVILLICGALFGTLYSTTEAFRVEVLKVVYSIREKYTEIRLTDADNRSSEESACATPSYLPTGVVLTNSTVQPNYIDLTYSLDNDPVLVISVTEITENSTIRIDTENAVVESIPIGSYEGFCIEKNGYISVTWTTEQQAYDIYSLLSKEETIRIAQSFYEW